MRSPPELKEVHPLGKSPVISIEAPGLERPLVLAESAPIVEYLYEHFGPSRIPQRYAEGKEGVGAENAAWIQYRVSTVHFHDARPCLMMRLVPDALCREYFHASTTCGAGHNGHTQRTSPILPEADCQEDC